MALFLGTLRGVLLLRYIHLLAAIHTTSGGVTPICDQADQSATMLFRLCYRNTDDLEPPSVTGARVPGLLGGVCSGSEAHILVTGFAWFCALLASWCQALCQVWTVC